MEFKEMTVDQVKAAMTAGTRDDKIAYLNQEGIEIPFLVPKDLPDETAKLGLKLWQEVRYEPREYCAEDEHDYQRTGNAEMERNSGTGKGSCFRWEYRCTKCGKLKWEPEVKPVVEEPAADAAAAPADDRAARRAARKAAREAAKAAQ